MNQSLNDLKKIANIFSPPLCFVLCMFYLCVIIVAKKQKFKLWSKFSHHKIKITEEIWKFINY